jgi:hypothetical protein
MGQASNYRLFGHFAAATTPSLPVRQVKVALMLDGLDERAGDLRPVALWALSHQASFA